MARKTPDEIDNFFEHGIDVGNRTIYMGSASYEDTGGETGVDFFMAEKFIKALHLLDAMAPTNDKPITIIMNNPGGDWYHGMAIYDAIKQCSNHVVIKMFGYAMSMGSIIPQAGDERVMAPNSRFMIHYGYDGYIGHSKISSKWADEGKRINHQMENLYLDRLMEKDEEMRTNGLETYLENTISDIMTRLHKMEYPDPIEFKYKFSKIREKTVATDLIKRREDIRVALQKMLDYDTVLTPEETVALGFADRVMSEDD